MECLVTERVSGPCASCHASMEPAHIVSLGGGAMALYCPDCCPIHGSQESLVWDAPAVTIEGEQESLF